MLDMKLGGVGSRTGIDPQTRRGACGPRSGSRRSLMEGAEL